MNIFVFGSTGMLGSAVFQYAPVFNAEYHTFGAHRTGSIPPVAREKTFLVRVDDIFDEAHIRTLFSEHKIDVVLNAIGVIKQLKGHTSSLEFIRLNAMFPHFLANLTEELGIRLINVSTDCVFTGDQGGYRDSDIPDAQDLYGRSKLLGEVLGRTHVMNIRTSIIGHESGRAASLIDWFLSQSGAVNGYRNAIFSGFPTVELTRVICKYVLPRPELFGLYHVSVDPINKFDLLKLVSDIYGHEVQINSVDDPCIDRSLNSDRFRQETGFTPKSWSELIKFMKNNPILWSA